MEKSNFSIVSVDQMVQLEKEANMGGMTYGQMMKNAGHAIAEYLFDHFNNKTGKRVVGLVGPGNNGGDTLVALTKLQSLGWKTTAYLSRERGSDDPVYSEYKINHGEHFVHGEKDAESNFEERLKNSNILLDGLLGTGISLPLLGSVQEILSMVRDSGDNIFIVAVDCPSGVDADTGEVESLTLLADQTICLAAVKRGLLKFPALTQCGEITAVDIGLPESLAGWNEVYGSMVSGDLAAKNMPSRAADSHKGTFGTCLVLAGSKNYPGAVLLASEAAYRVGAGLICAAIPASIQSTIAGNLPEATWLPLIDEDESNVIQDNVKLILQQMEKSSSVLIGPGIGNENVTRKFFQSLIRKLPTKYRNVPPFVFDASALRLLSEIGNWHQIIPEGSVLTPHPGEMAALTKLTIGEIQSNRGDIAREFSKKWRQVVVLKGAVTIIAEPSGYYSVIPLYTSALAKAGTGDVLAGMIAGIVCQGMKPYEGAISAAWIHAKCGNSAAKEIGSEAGVLASDVIKQIPKEIGNLSGIS